MKASELKKGMIVKENGQLWAVIEMEHRTPGNLRAIYQAKLKNVLEQKIIDIRYSPTDNVEKVDLDTKKAQYLFNDHEGYHFMDMDTYETIILTREMVGDSSHYLKENLEVGILSHDHRSVAIELPVSVELKVIETSPGARGDTSGRVLKPAKVETGYEVNVPIFIQEGEVIKIDTRNNEYLGRA